MAPTRKRVIKIEHPFFEARKIAEKMRKKVQERFDTTLTSKAICLNPSFMNLISPLERKMYIENPTKYIQRIYNLEAEKDRVSIPLGSYDVNLPPKFFERLSNQAKKSKDIKLSKMLAGLAKKTKGEKNIIFLTNPFDKGKINPKLFKKNKRQFELLASHEFIHEFIYKKLTKKLDTRSEEGLTDYLVTTLYTEKFPKMSTQERMKILNYPSRLRPFKGKYVRSSLKWAEVMKELTLDATLGYIDKVDLGQYNQKHKTKYKTMVDLMHGVFVKRKSSPV